MRRERVRFPGSLGPDLVGKLDLPAGEPASFALFAHCFTCSKDLKAAGRVSEELARRGIAVLRFDFTGLGESGGDFAETDFHSNLDDLVAAGDLLRSRYRAPELLIGHSLGGAAVLAAASAFPEAAAVATIGAPADTAHLRSTLSEHGETIEEKGVAEVDLGGTRRVRIGRELFDDLAEDHFGDALPDLGKALLVLHSAADGIVPIEHGRRIFTAAAEPKSFVELAEADHLLLAERDARYAGRVLAAWASRYVGTSAQSEPRSSPGPAAGSDEGLDEGTVVVTGCATGYTQEVRAGRHRLAADEPESIGGADAGPTPYDFLLVSLGSCTSMTLRMYADRKGWPLDGVRVTLRHSKVHARDCAECTTREGRIDRLERSIEIFGDLDDGQRRRLLEIADKCPVHRTLTGEIEILTELAE